MSQPPSYELTFEQALMALEKIVRDLEDGQIGLEDSLARYEAGVALLKRCYLQLSDVEQRIMQLMGIDENGKPVLQEFQHAATTDTEKQEVKRKRKKTEDSEHLF